MDDNITSSIEAPQPKEETEPDKKKKSRKEKKAQKEKKILTMAQRKKRKWIKRITKAAAVIIIVAFGGTIIFQRMIQSKEASAGTTYTTATVERRDITTVLSSSGSVKPLNTYSITTLVKGEIIAADFEPGDTVQEGDVLYQLTTDSVLSDIASAQKTVTRAQNSYDKAVANRDKAKASYEDALTELSDAQAKYDEKLSEYQTALAQYDNLYEISGYDGIISNVYVQEGDTIKEGDKIADLYSDSVMVLTVPFHTEDISDSWIGKEASVYVDGSFETITGKVTKISQISTVLSGNQIVRDVTIEVTNPGGISNQSKAAAMINSIDCCEEGSFAYGVEVTLKSSKGGEIAKLSVEKGIKVAKDTMLFSFSKDSAEDALSSYTNAVDNAESSLKNAKKSVESALSSVSNAEDTITECEENLDDANDALADTKDSLTDCYINSPVTGTVITKNMLVGDIIGTSNFNSTLATIYDVSALTFEMDIDELDIKSVQVGQTVNVTADALENQTLTGIITNVSLESTTSGGVTQYPVTVRIDDTGELLVGMNVTGEIILQGVTDVLSIPVDALKRGNAVYVKDDTVTKASGEVPAGFRSVTVETGLSDGDYIEITSGLSEGDEIYVSRNSSESSSLLDGFDSMFGGQDQSGQMPGQMPGGSSSGQSRPSGGNSGGNSGGGMGQMPSRGN